MADPRCLHCDGAEWTGDGRCVDPQCKAFPTLGYAVADLIESACVIPDGDHMGEPFVLPDEQLRFFLNFYRVDPATKQDTRERWIRPFIWYRGAQLVRPQKWGKGPLAAAWICAEAHPDGPVRFDGWDAAGHPVGRPWPTPHLQVTGVSEDQTDNVWRALVPMIELGALRADIPDTGKTRINLPNGGLIEPVTASAVSRLGQRVTGVVQDQTESWTAHNRGRQLADNQRRGLGGMGGRFLETPNAWDPTESSVAQQTNEGREPGVYIDDVEPGSGSIRNKAERRRMLRKVYGDSWWVDLDRIDGEIEALVKRDPAQAERWYLNRKRAAEDAAFDPKVWAALAAPDHQPPAKALVTLGVDGARFRDALAIVGTEVSTGHQWLAGLWERPEDAEHDYEHPRTEVDGTISELFDRFDVWRAYVDPQYIDEWVQAWQGRWGNKRVVAWFTNRPRQIAWAVRNFSDAVAAGDLSHDGDERFGRHIGNSRRAPLLVRDEQGTQMHTLAKDRQDSLHKIDAAMAGVLSWEARGDAIADGALNRPARSRAPVFL